MRIKGGESVARTGWPGAGETTLLDLMVGLEASRQGDTGVGDKSIIQMPESDRALFRANHVGFAFQSLYERGRLASLENV